MSAASSAAAGTVAGALAPASAELVARLGARPWAADFYLAGSAALALHVGHRPVRDLDLMSPANRLAPQDRRDLLADLLEVDPGTAVETARDGYLFVRSGDRRRRALLLLPLPARRAARGASPASPSPRRSTWG